jgi:hypothetical protein
MNARVKKVLETSFSGLAALLILTSFAVVSARAQSREEHFISARAGGVNFVSGEVKTRRAGEVGWRQLTTKDDVLTGDEVRTGADGRVEVLLNPGSYFRVGESTQFEMVDDSLDNLSLRITHGSAVIEAVGYDDKQGLDIAVATPQAHARIIRTGIYRFTVLPSGVTEVAVQKGRLVVVEGDTAQVVKGGQLVRVGSGPLELAKLNKQDRDALDLWSRDRGKELAKLNEKLASRQVAFGLRRGLGGIYSAASGGVWAFNSLFGCYTFLPFGYGWSSPYGYGYNSYFYVPRYAGTYGGGTVGQGGYPTGGGNTNPPGNTGGSSGPGTNTYPGNFNPPPSPPPASTPTRDVPSRGDVDRPMPERTYEPGSRPPQ